MKKHKEDSMNYNFAMLYHSALPQHRCQLWKGKISKNLITFSILAQSLKIYINIQIAQDARKRKNRFVLIFY